VSALVGKGPSGEALIDLCLTELGNFTGAEHEQEDDITLVSLQRSPSAWLHDPKLHDSKLQDPKLQDPKLQDPKLHDPKLQDPQSQATRLQEQTR